METQPLRQSFAVTVMPVDRLQLSLRLLSLGIGVRRNTHSHRHRDNMEDTHRKALDPQIPACRLVTVRRQRCLCTGLAIFTEQCFGSLEWQPHILSQTCSLRKWFWTCHFCLLLSSTNFKKPPVTEVFSVTCSCLHVYGLFLYMWSLMCSFLSYHCHFKCMTITLTLRY